ncbi:hypothetical protein VB620_07175 [Nodularia harveyana UHCC-0300]|uniref:Uncharacterized protein n=1 Tax=Nodularia harveyana UHCC-0300 TaxID=2974287 RepID=A0ABU5UC61_9CYAN|nr:hypothetical protein [Nodularia harveyana]MEA5581119.1 hypothetical protein [Nodularia harveyana UHCC-0300]
MEKIQRIINGSGIYPVISVKYAFWNLGTTLITLLLLFMGFSIESAAAMDNVVSENSDPELGASQNLIISSIASPLNSQPNVSLRQRLLESKKTNVLIIRDGLTTKVKQNRFSSSLPVDNFLLESQDKLKSNDDYAIINTDSYLKQEAEGNINLWQHKPGKVLVQLDSSSSVGDSFGETNKLRQELLIEPIVGQDEPRKSAPSSTAGTPSAYGASYGQAYIGGGLFFPLDQDKDRNDGSLSLGFGLGNPIDSVGLEVNINITSVGGGPTFDFGDSGGVGFKLHRYVGDNTSVAIGWSNPIKWGDVTLAKDTIYGVFTQAFALQPDNPQNNLPLTVSLGVGTGAFSSKGAIEAGDNSVNFFGGLGLRVIPGASLVSSWTGSALNVGGSFAPFKDTQIVINAIITDVTNNLDTGLGLAVTAGYGFRF